jgi:hypothetical protein
VTAAVIEIHRPRIHRIVELTLRAACELVAGGREGITSTSLTVDLREEDGAALELLRRAEAFALEFHLQVRMEVQARRATIRISRAMEH